MNKKHFILILFLGTSFSSLSQKPAIQKNHIRFQSEWFGGLSLHTSGWGFHVTRGKFKTYKITNLYNFEFVTMKHSKEINVNYSNSESSSFKFGKLNSLCITRLGYGKKYLLREKYREKGVEIFGIWSTGVNIGLVQPYYLEILKFDSNGIPLSTKSEERYNPSIHNESNIWSRAGFFKGFDEIKIKIGGHFKVGAIFEFAKKREKISAIETGIVVDYFPSKIPMMAFNKESDLFFNLYINIFFGRKYYD